MGTQKKTLQIQAKMSESFSQLFHEIAKKSIDEKVVSIQNICDHYVQVGAIKPSDGSMQDCHKSLLHYNQILMKSGLLKESGKFTEDEFVRFWYNCHQFFNSYDLSKFLLAFCTYAALFSKQWPRN